MEALGLDAFACRYQFAFPLNWLIRAYKLQGVASLRESLAHLLPTVASPPGTVLVPVPTLEAHVKARGEDPLHSLALAYARLHAYPWKAVRRLDQGSRQRGRSARQRHAHTMRFDLREGACSALILDDVLTTGKTIATLAKALKAAGSQWVGAVVLARTPGRFEVETD